MNQLVGVIGLGYVGLPLVEALLKSDFDVIGFDTDLTKLNEISQARIQIDNLDPGFLSESLHNGKLELKNTFESLATCRTIIVCVPTPLKDLRPDLSFVLEAAKKIGSNISEGTLVILESTVSPGTTRLQFLEGIQANSIVNIDKFFLAYSPERIDPGNKKWNLQNTPKLLAGINQASLKKAIEVYSNFIDDLVICNSIEEAELSKLIENSFRLINISFINEIMVYCDKLNIDVSATLKAAATKPYGYMSFLPSVGAGGHCVPVDPVYLSQSAHENSTAITLIDHAIEVNRRMPEYFVQKILTKVGDLEGKKLLFIGLSFKPNVSDYRESSAIIALNLLRRSCKYVNWHDDLVKVWNGEKSSVLSDDYDFAILAVNHDYLNLEVLKKTKIIKLMQEPQE